MRNLLALFLRLPCATILLLIIPSCLVYYGFSVHDPFALWDTIDPTRRVMMFLLHPIFHKGLVHLLPNIAGLFIVGSLIENWMTLFSRRIRYTGLLCCYLVSLTISFLVWMTPSAFQIERTPAFGLSAIVFGGLGFSIVYYSDYFQKPQLDIWDKLAPVCIGFLFMFFTEPFLSFFASHPFSLVTMLVILFYDFPHVLALVLALGLAHALLSRATPTRLPPNKQ